MAMTATNSQQRPAGTGPETGAAHRCPMCGQAFPSSDLRCHHGCPMVAHCRVLCCPHCGYEFVDPGPMERRLARWGRAFRRLLGRRSPEAGA